MFPGQSPWQIRFLREIVQRLLHLVALSVNLRLYQHAPALVDSQFRINFPHWPAKSLCREVFEMIIPTLLWTSKVISSIRGKLQSYGKKTFGTAKQWCLCIYNSIDNNQRNWLTISCRRLAKPYFATMTRHFDEPWGSARYCIFRSRQLLLGAQWRARMATILKYYKRKNYLNCW